MRILVPLGEVMLLGVRNVDTGSSMGVNLRGEE